MKCVILANVFQFGASVIVLKKGILLGQMCSSIQGKTVILEGSTFGSHYSCESFGIRFYQLCITLRATYILKNIAQAKFGREYLIDSNIQTLSLSFKSILSLDHSGTLNFFKFS